MENLSIETILNYSSEYGLKLLGGIIILIIGFWLSSKVAKLIAKSLVKKEVEESLKKFIIQLISILLKVLVVLAAAETVGFKTTSFIAVLGAAGLAIGLALQGSLANFAGGVLILLFKPYKVGDLIESQGHIGVVKEIEIFNTILANPENKKVVLPNGAVYNNPIVNFTENGYMRVDVPVGIDYDEDIQNARNILINAMNSIPEVLKDKEISVNVTSLGASSIDLNVRCFTNVGDYWKVYFGLTEIVNNELKTNNIKIPYPHTEVLHKTVN